MADDNPEPVDGDPGDRRPSRPARLAWGAVIAILLGVVGLVTYALTHVSSPTAPVTPAVTSPAVLATLSSVPSSTFDAIGVTAPGTTLTPPSVVAAPPPSGNRPEVLFVGSEFCPFCAAERWPLVVALARFGTFTRLHNSSSAAQSVFPDTSTFTFADAVYSSRYVTLTGVELYSDTTGPDGTFTRLARLTPSQAALVARYSPQGDGVTTGSSPFVDVAGRLIAVTSGLSPALLAGQSQSQIAGEIAVPMHFTGQHERACDADVADEQRTRADHGRACSRAVQKTALGRRCRDFGIVVVHRELLPHSWSTVV